MRAQKQGLVTRGRFNFGRYDAPFALINPLDAQPFALPVPSVVRDLRLKEWQAFQFANERYYTNIALFNTKALALVQVKVFDRQERKKYLFEKRVPPWSFRAPSQLLDSAMRYDGDGCHVMFENRLANGYIDIEFDTPVTSDCPALSGRVRALYEGHTPLVVAIPFGENRGMYSHKGLAPIEGELSIGSQRITYSPQDSYVTMDDHRGYYDYVMRWDWLTSGRFDNGTLFGFNLTHNASIDPSRFNENALWIDGIIHELPPIEFTHTFRDKQEVWEIRDASGRVEVDFEVEVPGRVDINALVMHSKYRGPFGSCRGHLVDENGRAHRVDGMFGMAEQFYLRV